MGVKHKSVKEALEYVSRHPSPTTDPINMPVWELIARQLYETAHQAGGTRTQIKSTAAAQKMILDRVVGKRRTGTHPAVRKEEKVLLADFTQQRSDNG